jgi:hypothetical protein
VAGATRFSGPASALLGILRDETHPEQAAADVRAIWETDRWFTFPKFAETARNVANMMRRADFVGYFKFLEKHRYVEFVR